MLQLSHRDLLSSSVRHTLQPTRLPSRTTHIAHAERVHEGHPAKESTSGRQSELEEWNGFHTWRTAGLNTQRTWGDKDKLGRLGFKEGDEFTVEETVIDGFSTTLYLREFPCERFNTVNFALTANAALTRRP